MEKFEEDKNEKKTGGVKNIILLIFATLLGFAVGFGLTRIDFGSINKEDKNDVVEGQEQEKDEINEDSGLNETEKNEANDDDKNANYIKTRTCVGIYSGTAAITLDVQTGEQAQGKLTINLKSDGTYELKKADLQGDFGTYTIIDNALLLKTHPHICPPDSDCSSNYTEYLNISEDCSTISWGYGSYFFNPDFTLTKQN